jgi:hypothetical protein
MVQWREGRSGPVVMMRRWYSKDEREENQHNDYANNSDAISRPSCSSSIGFTALIGIASRKNIPA